MSEHGTISHYTNKGCRCEACSAAQATYHAEWSRIRRQEWRAFIAAEKAKPCLDCGRSYPPEVMEFHHRPGEEKSFVIARATNRNRARVLEEIAKCDVLCANCHRQRKRTE